MAVKIGTADIVSAYIGTTAVDKIYIGTEQIWPAGTPAAALYADYFNRANNAALGSPWVGSLALADNKAAATAGGTGSASRYNQTFSADQWAECDIVVVPGGGAGNSIGPAVRMGVATNDVYFVNYDSNTESIDVWRRDAGGNFAQVITPVSTTGTGGKFKARLEAQGSTIRLFLNGVQVGTATDSSVAAAGQPGVWGANYGAIPTADNFRCGDLPYSGYPAGVKARGESASGMIISAPVTMNHPAFTPAAGSTIVAMPGSQVENNTGATQATGIQVLISDTFGDTGGTAWVKSAASNRGSTGANAWGESSDIWTRKIGTGAGSGVVTARATWNGSTTHTSGPNGAALWMQVAEVDAAHGGAIGAVANQAPLTNVTSYDVVLGAAPLSTSIVFANFSQDFSSALQYTLPTGFLLLSDEFDAATGWQQIFAAAVATTSPQTITWSGLVAANRCLGCAVEIKVPVTVLYSDDFNRADGALVAPWVAVDGSHSIVSNKVAAGPASPNVSYYNAAFSADQWVEADIVFNRVASVIFPCLRVNGSDFYYMWINGASSTVYAQIVKRVGGSYQQIGGDGGVIPSTGFKARFEVEGTTLRFYADGALRITVTDSSIATGRPGFLSANGSGATLDNFRAGNLPYTPVPVFGDDFNRADTTPPGLGAEWIGLAYYVSGMRAVRGFVGGGDYATFQHDVGTPDMWVEADVNPDGGFRVVNLRRPVDNSETGYMGFGYPGSGYSIGKVVAGVYSDVVTGGPASNVSVVTTLRLEAEGTALRLYANDVLVLSGTDSSIPTNNYAGLNCDSRTPGAMSIDNFRCGPLPYTPMPRVVAANVSPNASGPSVVNKPAGGQAGDYYLVWFAISDYSTPPTGAAVAGFTTDGVMRGVNGLHEQWFWKPYDGSEGSTFTVTGVSGWNGVGSFLVRGLPASWTPVIGAIEVGTTNGAPITVASRAMPASSLMIAGYKDYTTSSPDMSAAGWTMVAGSGTPGYCLYAQRFVVAGSCGPASLPTGGSQPNALSRLYSA